MDAGDPNFGAYFPITPGIGNFQSRARQLTPQAFGRAKVRKEDRRPAVFYFPPDRPPRGGDMSIKSFLIGSPIETIREKHERLSKKVGLAVFSSDPLSSVAYGTEEILFALVVGGAAFLNYLVPIAVVIVVLVAIVATSYITRPFRRIHQEAELILSQRTTSEHIPALLQVQPYLLIMSSLLRSALQPA